MSLIFLNYKAIVESKKVINRIINKRRLQGFEYPISLADCIKVNFKFNKIWNMETQSELDAFYVEWLIPALISNSNNNNNTSNGNATNVYKLPNSKHAVMEDEDKREELEEKKQIMETYKKKLMEYLQKLNFSDALFLDSCLSAIDKSINRAFKKTMVVKTDFVNQPDDVKLLHTDDIRLENEQQDNNTRYTSFYETEQQVTETLFEKVTHICFGKEMSKLGCEYTLFWQHCYKSIFKLFDNDDDDYYYYDNDEEQEEENEPIHEQRINLIGEKEGPLVVGERKVGEEKEREQGKLKSVPTSHKRSKCINIKKRLMKQPNMTKIKVRNEKYKQLANIMKEYIVMQNKDGKLVHNFKSPCPLQCMECIYDVKGEKFTYFYTYEHKRFQVSMDPLKGSAMVQHYSKKIVDLMD